MMMRTGKPWLLHCILRLLCDLQYLMTLDALDHPPSDQWQKDETVNINSSNLLRIIIRAGHFPDKSFEPILLLR